MAGLIIGKAGSSIQAINAETGATVRLGHEQELPPEASERIVYISGTATSIQRARDIVASRVGGRPDNPNHPLNYGIPLTGATDPAASQINIRSYVNVPLNAVGALLGAKVR